MTLSAAAASLSPETPSRHGMSFRAKLVLGVFGLVLLTGTVVLWLAHRSARERAEALTGSVFREVSGRAATHFIGTDGVWEMPDPKGEQYGKQRLREAIHACAARARQMRSSIRCASASLRFAATSNRWMMSLLRS
jgi:hypothetical protein